jgi:hypothetical protein
MKRERETRIRQTLDYIQKDKLVDTNPYFMTRLMARLEERPLGDPLVHPVHEWVSWLRPIVVTATLAIFLTAGIFIGKLVTPSGAVSLAPSLTSVQQTDELNRMLFELADHTNEQLLLTK